MRSQAVNSSNLAVVTGGAGFIGSHIIEALLADGFRVRVIDNLSTGFRSNMDSFLPEVEFVEGDLADESTCASVVAGATYVFHQAAIPSVPRSVAFPLEAHRNGPTSTLNLLEASRRAGVRRFMFAASSSAYGETDELPKHEGMIPRPLSPYAASKLAGEHYVRVYAQTMGLDGVSLRYFNVFGPRQDPDSPYSGVISLFAKLMRAGKRPTILGDGLQSRDFTYVANVVHANLLAMRSEEPLGGVALNVGTGRRITLLDLVDSMNVALGTQIAPEFGPPRDGDVRHSQASLDLIESTLGYGPLVEFEEGLKLTLNSLEAAP